MSSGPGPRVTPSGDTIADLIRDSLHRAMPPEGLEAFVKKFRRTVDDVLNLYGTMIRHQYQGFERLFGLDKIKELALPIETPPPAVSSAATSVPAPKPVPSEKRTPAATSAPAATSTPTPKPASTATATTQPVANKGDNDAKSPSPSKSTPSSSTSRSSTGNGEKK